jgi:hypothetical protein
MMGGVAPAVAPYVTGHQVDAARELHQVVTWAGVPVTLGGAYMVRNKFQAKRQEVLRRHPMAFLYEYS